MGVVCLAYWFAGCLGWWLGYHDFDLEVTKLVKPVEENTFAIGRAGGCCEAGQQVGYCRLPGSVAIAGP